MHVWYFVCLNICWWLRGQIHEFYLMSTKVLAFTNCNPHSLLPIFAVIAVIFVIYKSCAVLGWCTLWEGKQSFGETKQTIQTGGTSDYISVNRIWFQTLGRYARTLFWSPSCDICWVVCLFLEAVCVHACVCVQGRYDLINCVWETNCFALPDNKLRAVKGDSVLVILVFYSSQFPLLTILRLINF